MTVNKAETNDETATAVKQLLLLFLSYIQLLELNSVPEFAHKKARRRSDSILDRTGENPIGLTFSASRFFLERRTET
jgi:hypothetical protein